MNLTTERHDMAELSVTPATVQVRFTTAEKIGGLVRNLTFPVSAVTSVTVEPDGLGAVRGIRAPGLALPGRRKIGTWRGRGHRTLVSVRAGEPALRVTLAGQHFNELVLGHPDAARWAEQLTTTMQSTSRGKEE